MQKFVQWFCCCWWFVCSLKRILALSFSFAASSSVWCVENSRQFYLRFSHQRSFFALFVPLKIGRKFFYAAYYSHLSTFSICLFFPLTTIFQVFYECFCLILFVLWLWMMREHSIGRIIDSYINHVRFQRDAIESRESSKEMFKSCATYTQTMYIFISSHVFNGFTYMELRFFSTMYYLLKNLIKICDIFKWTYWMDMDLIFSNNQLRDCFQNARISIAYFCAC